MAHLEYSLAEFDPWCLTISDTGFVNLAEFFAKELFRHHHQAVRDYLLAWEQFSAHPWSLLTNPAAHCTLGELIVVPLLHCKSSSMAFLAKNALRQFVTMLDGAILDDLQADKKNTPLMELAPLWGPSGLKRRSTSHIMQAELLHWASTSSEHDLRIHLRDRWRYDDFTLTINYKIQNQRGVFIYYIKLFYQS